MGLPKLNATPIYSMEVPSTGQSVSFRPYLVKEEKILLIAFESKETKAILRAMLDIIGNCVEEEIDLASLATFDVEYMFLQIRSKSVGERSTILAKCKSCDEQNELEIKLDDIKVEVPENVSNIIELTDKISLEMKYPSYADVMKSDIIQEGHKASADDLFSVVTSGVAAILTEEERFDVKDSTQAELNEFFESLTTDQFAKVNAYFESMPSLKHTASFNCVKCGEANEVVLQGMADFF